MSNKNNNIRATVFSAAGFTGGELLRILLNHDDISQITAVSKSTAGKPVCEVHPHLKTGSDFLMQKSYNAKNTDVLFYCGHHGNAMNILPEIISDNPNLKIIDLSGDFRFNNPDKYKKYYGKVHTRPELSLKFVYGLPELNRKKIKAASLIANPGCFATAINLALAPAATYNLSLNVAVTGITGSSGSGISPSINTHHPTRAATLRGYKALNHQHLPEIEEIYKEKAQDANINISFVPVSGPFVRGIYAVCHFDLPENMQKLDLMKMYESFYKDEPFTKLVKKPPDLQTLTGSNNCDVFIEVQNTKAVVISAIDNLIKGASGQAVENMNLMMGLNETAGLNFFGVYP